jgi:diguanylate cyclase (GGDEF)-like protein
MREEIRNLHISFQDQILEAVTLSIGVAVFPMNGSTGEAILRAADAALYQAKDAGRDRVIVAN